MSSKYTNIKTQQTLTERLNKFGTQVNSHGPAHKN